MKSNNRNNVIITVKPVERHFILLLSSFTVSAAWYIDSTTFTGRHLISSWNLWLTLTKVILKNRCTEVVHPHLTPPPQRKKAFFLQNRTDFYENNEVYVQKIQNDNFFEKKFRKKWDEWYITTGSSSKAESKWMEMSGDDESVWRSLVGKSSWYVFPKMLVPEVKSTSFRSAYPLAFSSKNA